MDKSSVMTAQMLFFVFRDNHLRQAFTGRKHLLRYRALEVQQYACMPDSRHMLPPK
jgi:hypothetical protein